MRKEIVIFSHKRQDVHASCFEFVSWMWRRCACGVDICVGGYICVKAELQNLDLPDLT